MSQLSNVRLAAPSFKDKLPSTGETLSLKPFTVGDEKVLLIASQSENPEEMILAIENVINNCVKREKDTKMSYFDVEYLFVKLRSISVGEISNFSYACTECETPNEISVKLSEVSVKKDENHSMNVKINEELMFKMKYPGVEDIMALDDGYEAIVDIAVRCVDVVFYGEETIEITEAEFEDLRNIIEDMSTTQFEKVTHFLESMPKLKEEKNFTCSSCGHENKVVMEGMRSFF